MLGKGGVFIRVKRPVFNRFRQLAAVHGAKTLTDVEVAQ